MAAAAGETERDALVHVSPEAYQDALEEVVRLRRALLDVVHAWTPGNWHESVDAIQVLDRVKALLPARERRKLTRWLTQRDQ